MQPERTTYLSIKIKSLAAEARIIRKAERRARHTQREAIALSSFSCSDDAKARYAQTSNLARQTWFGLNHHRRLDVRKESRSAHLAYGFLRGMPYLRIEAKCHEKPDWHRVAKNVVNFSRGRSLEAIKAALKEWSQVDADLALAA